MFDAIPIPTPFQIGDVNSYLSNQVLVDPGPDSDDAWSALTDGLADHGQSPSDITHVLITHPHPDHFGLATRLRNHGATVITGPRAAPIIEDFEGRYEYERSFFMDFFTHHGMPRDAAEVTLGLPEQFLRFAPNVTVDTTVTPDETLHIGSNELLIQSTMGHAIEELVIAYTTEDETHALVGDHVLGDITPNPVLQPPDAVDDRRPRMLPEYNRSLESLRTAGFAQFLPGHRDRIHTPAQRIDAILAAHEQRTETVQDLLTEPRTAFSIMTGLFDDLPVTEYFAGMSEAIGHLDVLSDRDRVTRTERNGTIVFDTLP